MSQNHQSDQIIDVVNKQVWLCAVGDHWYNRSHLHWTSTRGDHVSGRMGGRSDPHQHSMPHILMLIVVLMVFLVLFMLPLHILYFVFSGFLVSDVPFYFGVRF